MAIIKVSTKPAVIVADYHIAIVKACATAQSAIVKLDKALASLILSKYGDRFLSYKEYHDDLAGIVAAAKARNTTGQYPSKAYAKAIKAVYKALPLATSPEAEAKRKDRLAALSPLMQERYKLTLETARKNGRSEAHAVALANETIKSAKAETKSAGAPAGQTQEHKANPTESLEQWVAAHDVYAVLDACTRILVADKSTSEAAKLITKAASLARQAAKPRQVKIA